MLDKIWTEAKTLEFERISVVKQLYSDIVEHNKTIFGEDSSNIEAIKAFGSLDPQEIVDELYSFTEIIQQKDLEPLSELNKHMKGSTDFANITEAKLKEFVQGVKIENDAPLSKLVAKKGLLKRD